MSVVDFLELERAFERERIVGAAAEVEHIARGGDEMRHRRDILVVRERGVQGGGRLDQMLDDLTLVGGARSEEHTSELQSLMRISYAVFCLKKKKNKRKLLHVKYNENNNIDEHTHMYT